MKKYLLPILFSFIGAFLGISAFTLLYPNKEETKSNQVNDTKYVYYKAPQLNTSNEVSRNYNPIDFTAAAAVSTPTVVNIRCSSRNKGFYWISGGGEETVSTGSGVIISPDGYIVTNHHVIEDGDKLEVSLFDNREFKAKLIGKDKSTDLALLKVEAEDLPFMNMGNSDSLMIGAWVLAVGNPFNLESTVTAGIVSAKGRKIDILEGQYSIESFIQTDAVVNPGNSGGALVNTAGELIGINTAIITQSGKYEGYSFAVPSNLVKKVVTDLRTYGSIQRGLLGVGIEEINSKLAKKLKLKKVQGVHITRVTPNSGADDAGIKRGDVINNINGKEIKTLPELQEVVATFSPGDTIIVKLFRNGDLLEKAVTLKNHINNVVDLSQIKKEELKQFGFDVRDLSNDEIKKFGKDGILVPLVLPQSAADNAQITEGYIITHINKKRIFSVEDFTEILKEAKGEIFLSGNYHGFEDDFHYIIYK